MNPEQPGATPPAPANNPYEFIMSPPKAPKKSLFGGGSGSSFIMKLALIVAAAVVLMIVIAVIVNVLFGSKTNATDLEMLTATQQELIRVSAENTQASDPSVIGAGLNTQLSVTTQQHKMFSYLATLGVKVNNSTLNERKNATTDEKLQEATAASTYDTTFAQVVAQALQNYSLTLKTAYSSATGSKEKALLATDYRQTQLLLTQWSSAAQTIPTQ